MNKKTSFFLFLYFILLLFPAQAQQDECSVRLLVWQDTLFGLIDGIGKAVLPCEYEDLTTYCSSVYQQGYIVAKRGGLWGVLDWNGHTLVPCRFAVEPQPIANSKGLFLITCPGKVGGVVNSQGDTVLPFQYKDLRCREYYAFEHGKTDLPPRLTYAQRIMTMQDDVQTPGRNLKGCMDEEGREVLPPIYRNIKFCDRVIVVQDTNGNEGVVDYSGRWIRPITPQYTYQDYFLDYLMIVYDKKLNREGLMAEDGRVVLPVQYQNINSEHHGGIVLQDTLGLWAMCNEKFQPLTPHRYKELFNLGELTFSTWYLGILPDGTAEILDTSSRIVKTDPLMSFTEDDDLYRYPLVYKDGAWRLIDPSGKILPQRYSDAFHVFSPSLLSVATDSLHCGIINLEGHVVVPLRYSEADAKDEDLIFARKPTGKVDVFNGRGRKLLSCWGVQEECGALLIANQEGKWAVANKKTGRRLSSYYEYIHPVHVGENACYWAIYDDEFNGKLGYLDARGREILPCSLDRPAVEGISTLYKFVSHDCMCGKLIYFYNKVNKND